MTKINIFFIIVIILLCGALWKAITAPKIVKVQDWSVTNLVANDYPGKDIGEKINNATNACPSKDCRISVLQEKYPWTTPIVKNTDGKIITIDSNDSLYHHVSTTSSDQVNIPANQSYTFRDGAYSCKDSSGEATFIFADNSTVEMDIALNCIKQ